MLVVYDIYFPNKLLINKNKIKRNKNEKTKQKTKNKTKPNKQISKATKK